VAHDTPAGGLELGLSKHRVEALTDGIFAVAMTLLVIELKLPEPGTVHTQAELIRAVALLAPKFISWLISFLVLGVFWFSHHRQFHFVGVVDGKLLSLNVLQLAFVSLLPFSSALVGEFGRAVFSQVFYSGNIVLLALFSLLIGVRIGRNPRLQNAPIPHGLFEAARFRLYGLIGVSLAAIGITAVLPGAGNMAYMLMWPIGALSRRFERGSPPSARKR
jgi:uncharacterized membrane protein